MPFLNLDLLQSGAKELGIELNTSQLELLDNFASILVETNQTLNLTRITEPDDIVTKHYLDSLTCLAALNIKPNAKVIDIGTGAGFPGIPIKIARPDLQITLLDSSQKKLGFIADAANKLGLHGVETVHARAEEAGRKFKYREQFDVAIARALSDMKILAELCLPFVQTGGCLIAQKSAEANDEITSAKPIIGQLGGSVKEIADIRIPQTDITRHLVLIAKIKPCPPQFPRHYSQIAKGR